MSDELRAASEAAIEIIADAICHGMPVTKKVARTRNQLASYLAESADSELAVTEEWLRSRGWTPIFSGGTHLEAMVYNRSRKDLLLAEPVITFLIDEDHPHGGVIDSVMSEDPPREYTTRGDIRLLCRALGVELNERKETA